MRKGMKEILLGLFLVTSVYAGHWQCYAENNYGGQFWGAGYTKSKAKDMALESCRWETGTMGRCYVTNWCDWVH